MNHKDDRKYWLDDMRNVDKIYYGLWVVCAIVVLADLFYEKYTYFSWENWIGFHGWYGFVACVGLVIAAKQMRRLLKRSEDYYDR
jgi:hypothetical protein